MSDVVRPGGAQVCGPNQTDKLGLRVSPACGAAAEVGHVLISRLPDWSDIRSSDHIAGGNAVPDRGKAE